MPETRATDTAPYNVCGVLVHARPGSAPSVRGAIERLPGVEVHGASTDGRLVVLVEDTADAFAAETLSRIHVTDGVLSAALVYHYCDPGDAIRHREPAAHESPTASRGPRPCAGGAHHEP